MFSNFEMLEKIVREIDLKECENSEEEREEIERAFSEGECSELGVKLNVLINNSLPAYFEKKLIEEHLQTFSTKLKTEAACLSGWRMLFQQLSLTTLFLHKLIVEPLPKRFKNSSEFNKIQNIAKQLITVRAQVQFTEAGDSDIHFYDGDKNFFQMQVITRFLDTHKLSRAVIDTVGCHDQVDLSLTTNTKALTLFILRIGAAHRMMRYGLDLIDQEFLLVNTISLQDHLPLTKQAFYFYQEAILETRFQHFLKIDLHDAKKHAFIETTDRITFSDSACADYFKEIMICQLFAFEAFRVVLADHADKCELPDIDEAYRRELKLIIDNEAGIRAIVTKISNDEVVEHPTQINSLHTYFDYAMFLLETQRIKELEEKDRLLAAAKTFWGIKYNIDCLIYIINCLRSNTEIYQHSSLDATYKSLIEPVKKQLLAPKSKVVEVVLKPLISLSHKEQFAKLEQQIQTLLEQRQAFYDIYKPSLEHIAVQAHALRKRKLGDLKNAIINSVMMGAEDMSQKLNALKLKRESDASVSELLSYETQIEVLSKQAAEIFKKLKIVCTNWNIQPSNTLVMEPLRRRHSDNSARRPNKEKKYRACTPQSIKPLHPAISPGALTPLNSPLASAEHPVVMLPAEKPSVTVKFSVATTGEITTQIIPRLSIVIAADAAIEVEEKISTAPVATLVLAGQQENLALQKIGGSEYITQQKDQQAAKAIYPAVRFFAANNVLNLAFNLFDPANDWRSEINYNHKL